MILIVGGNGAGNSVFDWNDCDNSMWLRSRDRIREEFIRGSFEKIPLPRRAGRPHHLYVFDQRPLLMDIMRFAGFSFEEGRTVFDGRFLSAEEAKTTLSSHGYSAHVLMNVEGRRN